VAEGQSTTVSKVRWSAGFGGGFALLLLAARAAWRLFRRDREFSEIDWIATGLFVAFAVAVVFLSDLGRLVFKQMRQRALGTWLTLLSILLSVALATAVLLALRESGKVFGQTEYGYDVVVGAKGSKLQLVLNTVYHLDVSPGNVPYAVYEAMASPRNPQVRIAVPYAVGDTFKGHRIVGTLPKLFGLDDEGKPLPPERVLEYRPGRKYELAEGRVFHPEKFEAVIGAGVAKRTGLTIGSKFEAVHGNPEEGQTEHVHEFKWEVVGILKPTQTANDGVLFIPLISFYAIGEHGEGLKAQSMLRGMAGGGTPALPPTPSPTPAKAPAPSPPPAESKDDHHDDHSKEGGAGGKEMMVDDHPGHDHDEHFHVHGDGIIHLDIPKEQWAVSAILVKARGGFQAQQLLYMINNGPVAMAVSPAMEMRTFFDNFLRGSVLLLLAISALVSVVAAVSILVSIYNAVSARLPEIAIMRALGATRAKILTMICLEAGFIGLLGGVLGLIVGHLLAGAGATFFAQRVGERIDWVTPSGLELVYLGGVVLLAVLAGLVPALKAYRTPVATNLVA